ncbi:mechanosensitive ion channel protein MscS [Devosia limi DSM 17137]|nr:mechanosensitive ion channel protein MscS [Devosia limi DSM 17137]
MPASAQVPGLPMAGAAAAPAPTSAETDATIDELIRIIEDDASRAVLLERLKQTTGDTAAVEAAEVPPDLSIARKLAEYTQAVAEGISATLRMLGQLFGELRDGFSGTFSANLDEIRAAAVGVLVVGVALIGGFRLIYLGVLALQRMIGRRVAGRNWPARIAGAIGGAAVDSAAVVLVWALGYVVALNVVGAPRGQMGINQSLLVNAFLVVELLKMVVRVALAPRVPALRLLPVGDANAAYWAFWLARIISLVGYTFMFVSPVIAAYVTVGAAGAVQVLVMATAVTIGIVIVLQNKQDVRDWLTMLAERRGNDGIGQVLLLIGQYWHMVAIAYLVALLVVWFANPEQALPFMLAATVQSVIAILTGVVIITFISRFIKVGLRLPADVKERLPLLEARLHAFVPRVMQVVRLLVLAGVLISVGQAWKLFDFAGWIASDSGQQLAGAVISAAIIVLICIMLHIGVASWVEYRLNPNHGTPPTAREKTLLSLFKNAFTVSLVVFGMMLALAQIGVNIAPLLAGAGVLGLAIGFGSQRLVQDIITGAFIQLENVMNEGDVVEAAGKSGVVERLTIRSVSIRDLNGTLHLIPFSSVDQVSNMVRGFSFHVAEIGVAYDSDIAEVKLAMQEAFDRLMQTEHKDSILDDLDMQGIIAFAASAVTVRARIKTLPGKHWSTGRAYSEFVKIVFAERGIEIPYPHVTWVQGGEARASGRVLLPSQPPAEPPAQPG